MSRWTRFLRRQKRMMESLDQDIRDYIERETQDNIERGMPPEEARYAALRKFGNPALVKEDAREVWGWGWLERLRQDLRYGLRMLVKAPGLTAVVVLSLVLGIGANTAIFSLIDAVMLRILPVKDPRQLVALSYKKTKPVRGPTNSGYGMSLSYLGFERLRAQNDIFSTVIGFVPLGFTDESVTVSIDGQPSLAGGEMVSGNYFAGLGVSPFLGRTLTEGDEKRSTRVAVLSFRYWTRQFGGNPAVLAKTITLGGESYTIVGVAPPEFFGVEPGRAPDFWVSLADEPGLKPWSVQAEKGQSLFTAKDWWWLMIMGRLKPGISQEQARAALEVWLRRTLTGDVSLSEKDAQAFAIQVEPASRGLDNLREQFSQPLWILMAVVGLVLLIACANVAALLLARAQSRRREIAVRLALGASRSRLVRQLLTESLILAFAGGLGGLVFAGWGARVLLLLMSGGTSLPLDVHLNFAIVGFAAGASTLTGILFGLAPAIGSTRLSLTPTLKETASAAFQATRGPRSRLGKSLVVAQVAFSLLLVAGAGLFVRTLMNLEHEKLGFDPRGLLLFGIDPTQSGYEGAELLSFYDRLLQRVRSLPGVQQASISAFTLISGWVNTSSISIEGSKPDQNSGVYWNPVGPNFLKTMRIRLLLGRDIREADTSTSARVAVVNQALARKFFGNDDPIGRSFSFGETYKATEAYEVVGVVDDARYDRLRGEIPRTAYIPFCQAGKPGPMHFEIRTAGDPALLVPDVRRAVREMDSKLALSDVKTETQQIDEALVQEKLFARLASFFGALALMLAAIGLYGTMTYTVGRRTNEIGIRVALGAKRNQIVKMVLREALLLVAIGAGLGLPLALAGARLVSTKLYGLKASDPLTFSASITLLLAVATLAAYLPARRASRVDPMVALRYE